MGDYKRFNKIMGLVLFSVFFIVANTFEKETCSPLGEGFRRARGIEIGGREIRVTPQVIAEVEETTISQVQTKFRVAESRIRSLLSGIIPQLYAKGIDAASTIPVIIEISESYREFEDNLAALNTDNFFRLAEVAKSVYGVDKAGAIRKINEEANSRRGHDNPHNRIFAILGGTTFAETVRGVSLTPENIIGRLRQLVRDANARSPPKAVGIGGGGGFINVTLQALRGIYDRILAIMPGTDNGGGTGAIQEQVRQFLGYIFGVGDTANVLVELTPTSIYEIVDAVLSFRPNAAQVSAGKNDAAKILINFINDPSEAGISLRAQMRDMDNLFFFLANQLNLMQVINDNFVKNSAVRLQLKDQSYRNMGFLAAYYALGAFLENGGFNEAVAPEVMYLLEVLFGVERNQKGDSLVHPVISSFSSAVSFLVLEGVLTDEQIGKLKKPGPGNLLDAQQVDLVRQMAQAIRAGRSLEGFYGHPALPVQFFQQGGKWYTVLFGQKYIDQVSHDLKPVRYGIAKDVPSSWVKSFTELNTVDLLTLGSGLESSAELVEAIGSDSVEIITVGAGSLFSSLLCQLAVPAVAEALIQRKAQGNIPVVLILNHVLTDETTRLTVTDYIKILEEAVSSAVKRPVKINELFTHILVNDNPTIHNFEAWAGGPIWDYMDSVYARGEIVDSTRRLVFSAEKSPVRDKDNNGIAIYIEQGINGKYFVRKVGDKYEPVFITPQGIISQDPLTLPTEGLSPCAIFDTPLSPDEARIKGGIYLNPYVLYMLLQGRSGTPFGPEMAKLAFLYMDPKLYQSRMERGRFKGALVVRPNEESYLTDLGIDVVKADLIGWTFKTLKGTIGARQKELLVGLRPDRVRQELLKILGHR